MEFEELCSVVFNKMPNCLSGSLGLSVFARERAKFEGWLKVELCSILVEHNYAATFPEKNRIDVTFGDWVIQLKTVNTNYRFPRAVNKHRPITKNVQGVIDDIENLRKLKASEVNKKAVLFAVFPVQPKHINWQYHLGRINRALGSGVKSRTFNFNNGIPGVIYIGLVT